MSLPAIFSLIQSATCLQMHKNCPINQRPESVANSEECDQKLMKPGEVHNELTNLLRAQSDQWFVSKSTETARPIRGQETAQIKSSVAKS